MSRRLTQLVCALIALAIFLGGLVLMHDWSENWNATPIEKRVLLDGDGLLPNAQRTTMAITVYAPAAQVWPWVAQMGAGRGGLYSYEWFENAINCQMVNMNEIRPEFQDIKPGDLVRMCAGDFGPPPWVVRAVVPGQALILGGKDPSGTEWTGSLNQIVLVPVDARTTRLFWRTSTTAPSAFDTLLGPGFFVMERRSLIGIQERAEGTIQPGYALDAEIASWLVCFVGFLIEVAATSIRHSWRSAFNISILAALTTLLIFLNRPPVWIDLIATILVWGVVAWSFIPDQVRRRNLAHTTGD